MKISTLLSVALLLIYSGCSSNNIEKDSATNNKTPAKIDWANEQIAPGYCRIIGTIVLIDSSLEKGTSKSPCSKVPCNAVVRIDSIIGYGSNSSTLSVNKLIDVHFNFTLSPTSKDLFPNMQEYYPGLQTGTRFEGDIYNEVKKGDINKIPARKFEINGYEIITIKII